MAIRIHRLPDVLPALGTPQWERLLHELRDAFASEMRDLAPGPRMSRIAMIHPQLENLVEVVREIHNGDVPLDYDEHGRSYPMPRVWRWEHHWHIIWVIELPAHLNTRDLFRHYGRAA